MYVLQNADFEAVFEAAETGLVGTLEVAIIDNDGTVVSAPTTAGITENTIDGSPSGVYTAELTAPSAEGQFTIVWSRDGTYNPISVSVEDLVVTAVSATDLPPIGEPEGGPLYGPCSAWTTVEDILECCTVEESSSNLEVIAALTASATAASEILFEHSGGQFAGICQKTVRPCRTGHYGCGVQVLSRGHLVNWDGENWGGYSCGCSPLSQVKLSGYPVREITEVRIDGEVVDESEYELVRHRYLSRKNGGRWPACQSLDLDDTEEGTFSVTYNYGQDPPRSGQYAAQQLACEFYKACAGLECNLPIGATRVTRQGITIERTYFQRDDSGIFRTGLPLVDAFLNSVNPKGLMRRPTIWSPLSTARYPRPQGT